MGAEEKGLYRASALSTGLKLEFNVPADVEHDSIQIYQADDRNSKVLQ